MLEKQVSSARAMQCEHGAITVLRIRRWVRWWFYVGVICGILALANIFLRNLTRRQEDIVLFLGVMHWLLGGLVCWAWDGIKVEKPLPKQSHLPAQTADHAPSANLTVRGNRRLRPKTSARVQLLTEYLNRWEREHHA